jgi:hypothetical protein
MIDNWKLILAFLLVLFGLVLIVTIQNPLGIIAVIVGERMASKVLKNIRFQR